MSEINLSETHLLPELGVVRYFPNFFGTEKSNSYFARLQNEIDWQQQPIIIFGKKIMQPRLTAWYGDEDKTYQYSGVVLKTHPWTPLLLDIKNKIELVSKVHFSGALLNLYRDQNDSMGWHRDNEKELGLNPTIASVSFGESRDFQMRRYGFRKCQRNGNSQFSIALNHGSLLLMQGETQHYWEHCVPKRTKTKNARINITFRMIVR